MSIWLVGSFVLITLAALADCAWERRGRRRAEKERDEALAEIAAANRGWWVKVEARRYRIRDKLAEAEAERDHALARLAATEGLLDELTGNLTGLGVCVRDALAEAARHPARRSVAAGAITTPIAVAREATIASGRSSRR